MLYLRQFLTLDTGERLFKLYQLKISYLAVSALREEDSLLCEGKLNNISLHTGSPRGLLCWMLIVFSRVGV